MERFRSSTFQPDGAAPNRHLFMVRPHLRDIPETACPPGIHVRTYRPGDEREWLELVRAAYGGPWPDDSFQRCVLADASFLPERLLLAVEAGRIVGAVGALQKLWHGDQTGYIHMMAVLPERQRRGTGAALLTRCLDYFSRQGWHDAVLDTETTRLPAIRLYLAHGFLPAPEIADDLDAWREALERLGRPDLAAGLRIIGPRKDGAAS